MTVRNKPLAEDEQTLALLMHARAEPQVLDLPRDDPWVADYLEQFALRHPDGARWVWGYLPSNAPQRWEMLERGCDGFAALHVSGHLVLLTGGTHGDHRYLHMVVSPPEGEDVRFPPHEAALGAKMAFLPGLDAYIAIPAIERYPQDITDALHLWFPVGGAPALPDFRDRFGRW